MKEDVKKQVNLRQKIPFFGTVLHLAIKENKNPFMLKYLLETQHIETKDLLKEKDPKGKTPLHLAAEVGNLDAIELLYEQGVDLNEGDNEENGTALHYAVRGGRPEAIELLDWLGAKLYVHDKQGATPMNLIESLPNTTSAKRCEALLVLFTRKENRHKTAPPNFMKKPPFNLVFKGGGPDVNQSIHSSRNDLLDLAKDPSTMNFLKVALKEYWNGWQTLQDPIQSARQLMERLSHTTGVCDGEVLRLQVEELIEKKTEIKNCTFKDLQRLIAEKPKIFKDLHIYSIRLNHAKDSELIRFSYEDERWHQLIISDAIRASASIPGVFTPHILHFKDSTGRVPAPQFGQFVDGGLLINYPLEAFDDNKYQEVGIKKPSGFLTALALAVAAIAAYVLYKVLVKDIPKEIQKTLRATYSSNKSLPTLIEKNQALSIDDLYTRLTIIGEIEKEEKQKALKESTRALSRNMGDDTSISRVGF